MKRLLSIFLTVVICLSIVASIPAFAADDDAFKVDNTTYPTLAEAYEALPEEGGVIELIANYESATDVGLTFDKPVTIKSEEGTICEIKLTAATEAGARWIKSTAALNIMGIKLETTRGIEMDNAPLTITDSTVLMNPTWSSENKTAYGIFSFLDQKGSTATFVRSTIEHRFINKSSSNANYTANKEIYGANAVRLWGEEVSLVLEDNSTLKSTGRYTNTGNANHVILVDYFDGAHEGTAANITVGENCAIINALTQGGVNDNGGKRPATCVYVRTGSNEPASGYKPSTLTVTLENNSRLELNTPVVGYSTVKSGWLMANTKDKYAEDITVIDNGCTFAVKTPYTYGTSNVGSNHFDMGVVYFPNISNAAEGATFNDTTNDLTYPNLGSFTATANISYEFKFGTPPAPEAKPFTVVGGEDFETLAEAIAAAADNATIILNRDYTSATDTGIVTDKALTIKSADGEKYTITIIAAEQASARWIKTSADLTIENIKLETTQGIETTAGTLTLNGVTATMSATDAASANTTATDATHGFIVVNNATATLNNTQVTHTVKGVGTVIALYGTATTLNLTNGTTLTANGTISSSGAATKHSVIYANAGGVEGSTVINVGENCVLTNSMTGTNLRPSAVINLRGVDGSADRFVVTLDKGAKLYMNTKIVQYKNTDTDFRHSGWIVEETSNTFTDAVKIIDNGCIYAANYVDSGNSEDRFQSGVINFPRITATADNAEYVFISNLDKYETVENDGSTKLTAGEYVEFTFTKPEAPEAPLVSTIDGAQIRTDAPLAIRFGATIDADTYAKLVAEGKQVTFGLIITPDASVIENFVNTYSLYIGTDNTYFIGSEWSYAEISAEGTYTLSMYVDGDPTLSGISASDLSKTFYACAYYVIDNSEIVMSETVAARSFYDVAKAYQDTVSADNAYVNSIVSRVES